MNSLHKKSILILLAILLLFLIIFTGDSSDNGNTPKPQNNYVSEVEDAINKEEKKEEEKDAEKREKISKEQTDKEDSLEKFYPVVRVIDGDTVNLNIEGNIETVRLIGLDTPESVDPRKPVQCFGKEASKKAEDILTG